MSTSTTGFVGETERGTTRPTLVTSWAGYQRVFGGYIDQAPFTTQNFYLSYAVRGFFDNGGQRLYVARVMGPGALTAAGELAGANGATTIQASGPGAWGNRLRIAVTPASAALSLPAGSTNPAAQWFRIKVLYYRDPVPNPLIDPTDAAQLANPARRDPDAFEDFDNLSHESSRPNYARTVVNGASNLITIAACPSPPNLVAFQEGALTGTAGTDVQANVQAFIGDNADPELRTGLEGLLTIRDISLMAVPDEFVDANLTSELLDRCERAKDRFAILNETTDTVNFQAIAQHRDSTYGALYYPRIRVVAPHTPEGYQLVPPAGHMAGIYARTDIERGVHKAPANEVVRGIVSRDLNGGRKPLSHTLNKREHDILNPRGVNVLRDFRSDGRDIRVWGARTMSSDSMWKYVNVRRLFIFLEQSIDRGTQWAVFEPNSDTTWISIRTSITNFLRTVWRNGALMGTTQDEAFFVKCDRTTMTQDDFDNGRLICLIGVSPVKPAEYVIFRISQKTMEAES
ncbi:MAG TPA: phage tail sheath C-terminal domain-containing protein [Vicinamibacteria bacterium]